MNILDLPGLDRVRRAVRRGVASVVVIAAGFSGVAEAGPSGLPWQSGGACIFNEFAAWRGRPLDVHLLFAGHETWAEFVQYYQGGHLNQFIDSPAKISFSMPLIAWESNEATKFSQCYNGKFDKHFRAAAFAIVRKGLGDSYIRLGWEANNGSHPWYIGTKIDAYKKCWRRIATLLKSISPSFKLEWVNARKGEQTFDMRRAYPGNDVVDVIGAHNYDRFPNYPDQAAWDQWFYSTTEHGQPRGIGAWLQFAKSKNKKFSVSEWAVSDGYSSSGSTDNAFYIRKMFEFFGDNAAALEYESYFNCLGGQPVGVYRVYPPQDNPAAATQYRALWSATP